MVWRKIFLIKKDNNQIFEGEDNYVKPRKKIKPLIAGILLISTSIIGILLSTPFILIDEEFIDSMRANNEMFEEAFQNVSNAQIKQSFLIIGVIGIIISALAFIGGILSILRKKWMIALIISIITTFTIILLIIPGVFSIIAAILIYLSKNDFK